MRFQNITPIEYDFGGSRARLLVSGEQSAGSYCMIEIFSPAGRATPNHKHGREDETIHMLDGELDVDIEGTLHTLHAGDTLMLHRGTAHQLINRSGRTARYLVLCAPAGFDEFVASCAERLSAPFDPAPPSEAAKDRMRAAAPKFGITLLPPGAAKG
ncbi:cupin domain-containing protein [Paraburkholderia sp. PREW-6R]|uniref:cupin domain-containing protein n=1 Tax=Paraburkholderia sp. PREW-6R TaxID=3141544 RepID=UPI0031F48357